MPEFLSTRLFPLFFLLATLSGCNNNPYGTFPPGKVVFSALSDDPRTLDPARVSDTTSNGIASNIHDTPFQYHYLKRPLQVIPSMATSMPVRGERVVHGERFYTFRFSIKKGLRYQDDPCFKNDGGRGREITIDDIVYSIERAADSSIDPFGMPLLSGALYGFDAFSKELSEAREKQATPGHNPVAELYARGIPGVKKIDRYSLELLLTENSPRIIYFFTLTTGSPIPPECLAYYNGEHGRPSYDRHPVASGPYYLKEWHSRYRIILAKNPNYRTDDFYPLEGNPGDRELGLLALAGRRLPLVDEFHFQIVRAAPPLWTLFEQGYLDRAGIPREVFDQVIRNQELTSEYKKKGIKLDRDVDVSTFWWYFNMKDPVVGRNPALRQAISLAVDRRELIERFFNNRGVIAESVIPPGIEGYFQDFRNPYSHFNLALAKKKLAEAGYPGGIDPSTGRPLKLHLTLIDSPGATSQNRFFIDQLSKINVNLDIEQLDWPTVLEKKVKKNFQMIHGGWHADYPDPQNFLQLFYGPNSQNSYNENSYRNPAFDRLYEEMQNMSPGPVRDAIIRRMEEILAKDAPAVFLFHPVTFGLSHQWVAPLRPHPIDANQLKYRDIDPELRGRLVAEWNRPPWWAYAFLAGVLGIVAILAWMAIRQYRRMDL